MDSWDATPPAARFDLQFFPVQHEGRQLVVVKDHLGLVREGQALPLPLYQFMTLLDGTRTPKELRMEMMRQQGGVLVGEAEIHQVLAHLDESFLLDSERFQKARAQLIAAFISQRTRPAVLAGQSYPENPSELRARLDDIIGAQPSVSAPEAEIKALVAPHMDLSVGYKAYSCTYQMLAHTTPSRVVILGTGHQLQDGLFSLTEKDFETPLGVTPTEQAVVKALRETTPDMMAADDFVHRAEHSIEFQLLFLQHLLKKTPFTLVPILCGNLQAGLSEYTRGAFLKTTGPFLEGLRRLLTDPDRETLLVAGVDLSHTGPKFGHEMPASNLQRQFEAHDTALMAHLCRLDADAFWQESARVNDQFNVCGFSALACLLEILPPSKGEMRHYEIWHEGPTRSAVSFASAVFTS
ncbi:MAG: AmmeMemoRadiSam system protein B [Thermodesulfobacteriota bacterium]